MTLLLATDGDLLTGVDTDLLTGPPNVPTLDYTTTIISQYANSPVILRLIQNMQAYLLASADFDSFFDLVWNVDTAVGYGLDVWGRIVGVTRVLNVAGSKYLGFAEQSPSVGTFGESIFYSGQPTTSNYALTDDAFRTLILAKALFNICDGSIPAINQIMLALFPGRGNAFVNDAGSMSLVYTFNFTLSPVEASIVSQSGILPKPAGVSATIVQA